MHWDAKAMSLTTYDGLAAAPSRVTAALAQDFDGKTLKSEDVARGGRSVGVPGALSVLKTLHERHGKLPWERLFEPAIQLANEGFPFPRYMHTVLSAPNAAKDHSEMLALYFDADQRVLPLGAVLKNPAYANTMNRIAKQGPAGFFGARRWRCACGRRAARCASVNDQRSRSARLSRRAQRAIVRTISGLQSLRDGSHVVWWRSSFANAADDGSADARRCSNRAL